VLLLLRNPDSQALSAAGIPSTLVVASPAFVPGARVIALVGIAPTATVGAPALIALYALALAAIASTLVIGQPAIAVGAALIAAASIASTLWFGGATLEGGIYEPPVRRRGWRIHRLANQGRNLGRFIGF
jgi:hypothetical protein